MLSCETSYQHGVLLTSSESLPTNSIPNPTVLQSADFSSMSHVSVRSSENSRVKFQDLIPSKCGENTLLFTSPATSAGRTVPVYSTCRDGSCSCRPLLNGVPYQLLPCRFASLMFDEHGNLIDKNFWPLFCYIVDGFPVVDSPLPSYTCMN